MATRKKDSDSVQPVKRPSTDAELRAVLERIGAVNPRGGAVNRGGERSGALGPAGPGQTAGQALRLGQDPAVDAILEKLHPVPRPSGSGAKPAGVMRTAGQDAAAGYVAPMPLPAGWLGAIDSQRVRVNEPGVTVKEPEDEEAGPRDFAKEKQEILRRMFEYADDAQDGLGRQVFINGDAVVELRALEAEERKVVGDGPLSMPSLDERYGEEEEEERAARSGLPVNAEQSHEVATGAGGEQSPAAAIHAREAGEQEEEETVDPARASVAPMVTPPRGMPLEGADGRSTRGRLAVLGLAAAVALVAVWRVAASPQGRGQAATEGAEPAMSMTAPSVAAPGPAAQVEADAGEAVETNPPVKADADAGEAVKRNLPEKKERGSISPAESSMTAAPAVKASRELSKPEPPTAVPQNAPAPGAQAVPTTQAPAKPLVPAGTDLDF